MNKNLFKVVLTLVAGISLFGNLSASAKVTPHPLVTSQQIKAEKAFEKRVGKYVMMTPKGHYYIAKNAHSHISKQDFKKLTKALKAANKANAYFLKHTNKKYIKIDYKHKSIEISTPENVTKKDIMNKK